MSVITASSLLIATKILRSRLIKPQSIGANILDPEKAIASNIDDNFGKFIGFFVKRVNNEPCFVLFSRSDPNKTIDHLFIFYLRHKYAKIQQSELKLLKAKMPRLLVSSDEVKLSVINVQSEAPKSCDLSILIQTVEFSLSPDLMTNFVDRQDIKTGKISSFVCFNPNLPLPKCNLTSILPENEKIWAFVATTDLKVIEDRKQSIPDDFHLMITGYSGHAVYIIHHIKIKSIMLLLPHHNHFSCEEDANDFVNELKNRLLPYKPRFIGATRYYGDVNTCCNSQEILKACILSLSLVNNLICVIKRSDVETVITDEHLDLAIDVASRNIQESESQSLSDEELDVVNLTDQHSPNDSSIDDNIMTTDVRFEGPDGDPEVLSISSPVKSSQDTLILSYENVSAEFRQSIDFNKFLDEPIPPLPNLEPRNDMNGEVLHDLDVFQSGLDRIGALFNKYATVHIAKVTNFDNIHEFVFDLELESDYRFFIIPFLNAETNVMILIDKERCEWVYISPENEAVKDHEIFGDIDSLVGRIYAPLKDMLSWPIMITSSFHREYPKIHLLMSLFYLVKLFKYSVMFPQKVIYGERETRLFCYYICLEQQLKNHEYNTKAKLVDKDGNLLPNAYTSIIPSIPYEKSVIPKDQCPFCKKRCFNSLARHMCFKHGGQSDFCNKIKYSKQ